MHAKRGVYFKAGKTCPFQLRTERPGLDSRTCAKSVGKLTSPFALSLFILSSFPRRRESMWSCHEKIAIGHGHVGSRFRGKDETRLTQSGK